MKLSELGQRIRRRREKCHLRQNDLAAALQVSPQAVSKWERGENAPDITLLAPLAKLLSVSADWLLGGYAEDRDVFEATVLAACASGEGRFSEVSIDPFGERRLSMRQDSRGRVTKIRRGKRSRTKPDFSPPDAVIAEFPVLPETPSQAAGAKALWTPAGAVPGKGFDNIASMDLKDTSWMASPGFTAYGLGVVASLTCEELDSGGTGLRLTIVDAIMTRGPETNGGKE